MDQFVKMVYGVRHNLEINDLLQGKDIVRHIKSLRLSHGWDIWKEWKMKGPPKIY